MSRILIGSYSIMGHYRPMVRIAQKLVEAGHEVMWLSDFAIAAVGQLGCQVRTLGVPNPPQPTGEEKARINADPEMTLKWQRWVRCGIQQTHIEPFRAVVREFRPDVIAADAMMYSAFISAHLEHVPWVSIFTSLNVYLHWFECALKHQLEQVAPDRAEMFASFGLTPDFLISECLSPTLNLSFITRELIGPDAVVPKHTLLAGPSIPAAVEAEGDDFSWDKLPTDRPIVYVSFGSMNFWQPELIKIVSEAAEPLGVQLVISCGKLADSEHVKGLPGNPLVCHAVPQPRLLEQVAVFVSHAGAGSLMDACYAGVPMLAIPITSDQPSVAHLITHMAKIGMTIDPSKLDVANCREALVALLADHSEIRTNMQRVKASYREQDGGSVAAEALARVAAESRARTAP